MGPQLPKGRKQAEKVIQLQIQTISYKGKDGSEGRNKIQEGRAVGSHS